MSFAVRKNQSGGSAMGGGADYQAEAYAFVSAKILAGEALNWANTGCNGIPNSVRMETGSGGDDLLISLQQGSRIELQAKKGIQRGQDLWDALMGLAYAVHPDANTYGVLLTNTNASSTVREELKAGIERIGDGFDKYDELPDIVQEFVNRLTAESINPQDVCNRLFIRIWNSEPGSLGEEITVLTIRKVIAQPGLAGAARSVLVSDGLDRMTLRGEREAVSLAQLLQRNGIALSHTARNLLVAREAYLEWCIKRNTAFYIPSLNLPLPIEKAWVHLQTMGGSSDSSGAPSRKPLEEQIRSYHEWYRLAETHARDNSISIEMAARVHRLLVIIAGPGAGKSTLLRRLVHTWAQEGKLLLHISLRRVSQLIAQGETFEDAVRDTALDGFGCDLELKSRLLKSATHLLADGLDETDPRRDEIARHLYDWALADEKRRVVVTTRPVGHNPAWFANWEHLELLPLDEYDVRKFAVTVLAQLSTTDATNTALDADDFIDCLKQSQAARLASRNPLLLGFLIALYTQGRDLSISRYRLFASILDLMGRQTRSDRVYRQEMNEAEARRAIDCLGWLLMKRPAILEVEIIQEMGSLLADSFGLSKFSGEQKARQALDFWEERGLLEAVGAGTQRTYTFVYMTFQEFAAARYLAQITQDELVQWVEQHHLLPRYREMLLLAGGTDKAEICIDTHINAGVPDDPVSTVGLLAAEVLAEMENPPNALRQRVIEHLAQRITSPIPSVAYEAGERLIPFAPVAPALIGPLALNLSTHAQKWTREVACALGLLTDDPQYTNEQALIAIYPSANDAIIGSRYTSGLYLRKSDISRQLILCGARYLLQPASPQKYIDVVKQKYSLANHSGLVHDDLEKMLRNFSFR